MASMRGGPATASSSGIRAGGGGGSIAAGSAGGGSSASASGGGGGGASIAGSIAARGQSAAVPTFSGGVGGLASGGVGAGAGAGGPIGGPGAAARRKKFQLTEEQQQEIREAFELFDTNKDGKIDPHEMKVAMRALGFDARRDEVVRLMEECCSRDGAGHLHIDLNDFTDVMTDKFSQRDPRQEMLKAFELFDENNTGKISLRSLRRVARELGENMTDEELQAMIDEFDKDQDGEINREEFLAIMLDDDD